MPLCVPVHPQEWGIERGLKAILWIPGCAGMTRLALFLMSYGDRTPDGRLIEHSLVE